MLRIIVFIVSYLLIFPATTYTFRPPAPVFLKQSQNQTYMKLRSVTLTFWHQQSIGKQLLVTMLLWWLKVKKRLFFVRQWLELQDCRPIGKQEPVPSASGAGALKPSAAFSHIRIYEQMMRWMHLLDDTWAQILSGLSNCSEPASSLAVSLYRHGDKGHSELPRWCGGPMEPSSAERSVFVLVGTWLLCCCWGVAMVTW